MKGRLLLFGALLALGGCAETTFQDMLGVGKEAPNENLVRTNPPLSVPPDMNLRPPSGTTGDVRADAAPVAAARPLPAPGAGGPAAGGAVKTAARGTGNASVPAFYDIYTKHGINIRKPDGSLRPVAELNKELARKQREMKRRENPNYGTIFNIGSLWK